MFGPGPCKVRSTDISCEFRAESSDFQGSVFGVGDRMRERAVESGGIRVKAHRLLELRKLAHELRAQGDEARAGQHADVAEARLVGEQPSRPRAADVERGEEAVARIDEQLEPLRSSEIARELAK